MVENLTPLDPQADGSRAAVSVAARHGSSFLLSELSYQAKARAACRSSQPYLTR